MLGIYLRQSCQIYFPGKKINKQTNGVRYFPPKNLIAKQTNDLRHTSPEKLDYQINNGAIYFLGKANYQTNK